MAEFLSAAQAASELGINLATLYAYVSRGLIRSEAEGRTRRRRYHAEDVWLLKRRREHRRDPARAVQDALYRGLPVLESRISVIHEGRLYYAGRDVVELAISSTIEQVAWLLWAGDPEAPFPEDLIEPSAEERRALAPIAARLPALEAFRLFLPVAAARDPFAFDLRPDAVRRAGARILRLLAGVAAGTRPTGLPVADVLQRHWAPRHRDVAALLQAALVLYADNGLNPSSFTARCVASAGSTPYAVVSAGLAALQGTKHGGACERAEGLLAEAGDVRGARRAVTARLRRGEPMPGFGHPLYPQGDPRAALLMKQIAAARPRSPEVALSRAVADAVAELMREQPTIDFAVVTLCRALRLPAGAPLSLLGLGRVVGWIAHGLEQYEEGREIRPRARYRGEPPASLP